MNTAWRRCFACALLAVASASNIGCSSRASSADRSVVGGDDGTAAEETPIEDDGQIRANETYAEFDDRRDNLDPSPGEVDGYGCTQDCSGHEAGYSWAEQKGITEIEDCGGRSWSFHEGCIAYVKEHNAEDNDDRE